MSQYFTTVPSPIGDLRICQKNQTISHLLFEDAKLPEGFVEKDTPLLNHSKKQLLEYFAGHRKNFDLPLEPLGTSFQQKVWKALQCIPYGTTCSYSHIAEQTGNPKACRAVGGANNKNPIPLFIPCHRVVGKSGNLTGYAGGLRIKEFLLDLESKN